MRILDGRSHFYQWDLNQRLTAEGLEVGDELHFANALSTEALVVKAYALEDGTVVADVPNALLRDAYPVTAYRYVAEGTAEHTIKAHTFQVQKRPRPSDYIYTETEVHSFEQLAEKVKEALGKMEGFDGDKQAEMIEAIRGDLAGQAEMIEALEEADEAIREELSSKDTALKALREADVVIREELSSKDDALKALREADVVIRGEIAKKADATATEEALAGKSAVKVGGQFVSEFDADTKLEKNTVQGWGVRVYAVENSGEQNMYALSGLPSPLSIAFRRAGGALNVGTATEEAHAVPLAQMNEALTEKADVKAVDTLAKKVENIEAGTAADAFIVDDSAAYIKPIPADVAPYAELQSVGGMTYTPEGMPADISALVVDHDGYEIGIDAENQEVRVGVDPIQRYYDTSAPFSEIFKDAEVGKTYVITYDVRGGTGGSMYIGTLYAVEKPFVLTEAIYNSRITFYNDCIDTDAGLYAASATFSNIKISEIGGATRYAKVTALEIRNASGEVTHTIAIPAAVQALEGYGKTDHRIEWDEGGKPWWVTPEGRTDISHLLAEDNLIPVEGGGTITAVNAEGLAAPITIVYQKRNVYANIGAALDEVHEYAQALKGGATV